MYKCILHIAHVPKCRSVTDTSTYTILLQCSWSQFLSPLTEPDSECWYQAPTLGLYFRCYIPCSLGILVTRAVWVIDSEKFGIICMVPSPSPLLPFLTFFFIICALDNLSLRAAGPRWFKKHSDLTRVCNQLVPQPINLPTGTQLLLPMNPA